VVQHLSSAARGRAPIIDTSVPQTARIWNYWLGGKDNFAVDRWVGDEIKAAFPEMVEIAKATRAFLDRAVRYLVVEAGVRQFLDIGPGLPTARNTHEIAQEIAPESLVVYVDNDPLVLSHARALLTSSIEGSTEYVDADLRDPDTILRQAARTLDLDRPVGIVLLGVLGHMDSYDEASAIVRSLIAAVPSGSHLAISDATDTSDGVMEAARIWNRTANPAYHPRRMEQVIGYFGGLTLVEPGVVALPRWRPDAEPAVRPAEGVGGVGCKA
jgi:O-methyltransferase involved in polyketide biosynthesis